MHRPTIGIITLLLFAAIPVVKWRLSEDDAQVWVSGCLRVGLIMAALWLAHPQLAKIPPKVLIFVLLGVFALGIFVVRHPGAMALLAAIALVLSLVRPRIETNRLPPATRRDRQP